MRKFKLALAIAAVFWVASYGQAFMIQMGNFFSSLTAGTLVTTGTATINGATSLNGNVTLGDAANDAITINGNTTAISSFTFVSGSTLAAQGFVYIDKSSAAILAATQASIGTSFTPITGSTITIAGMSANSTVECKAALPFLHGVAAGYSSIRWMVDGLDCNAGLDNAHGPTTTVDDTFLYPYCVKTGLSAGNHTFSLMAASSLNTISMRGAAAAATLLCREVH